MPCPEGEPKRAAAGFTPWPVAYSTTANRAFTTWAGTSPASRALTAPGHRAQTLGHGLAVQGLFTRSAGAPLLSWGLRAGLIMALMSAPLSHQRLCLS